MATNEKFTGGDYQPEMSESERNVTPITQGHHHNIAAKGKDEKASSKNKSTEKVCHQFLSSLPSVLFGNRSDWLLAVCLRGLVAIIIKLAYLYTYLTTIAITIISQVSLALYYTAMGSRYSHATLSLPACSQARVCYSMLKIQLLFSCF